MKSTVKLVKLFCKRYNTQLVQLRNDKSAVGIDLRKRLAKNLVKHNHSIQEVADVLLCRVQLADYYANSSVSVRTYAMDIRLLQAEILKHQKKVIELTELLYRETTDKEFDQAVKDRTHSQNKVIELKQKINHLKNKEPLLGHPDPETKWNAKKNGNPI